MIEIWMKQHLVSDIHCDIVINNAQIFVQGMTNNVRFTFRVDDTSRAVYN